MTKTLKAQLFIIDPQKDFIGTDTGDTVLVLVTAITSGGEFGLPRNLVVMSTRKVEG